MTPISLPAPAARPRTPMFPLPQPEDDRDRDDGHEADEPMELGAFLARVEEESRRHHRYLRGYGLVRIAAVDGLRGREALEEALQTETRRTDTVCALPDGSFAILCVESGLDACLALAKRLQVVAMELSPGSESLVPFPAGVAASNVVRVRADELWAAASHCFARARQSTTGMVWLPGGD